MLDTLLNRPSGPGEAAIKVKDVLNLAHMDRLASLRRTISRKHLLASAAAFLSIFLLLFLYIFSQSHSESSSYAGFYDVAPSDDCILDVDILRSYGLLNESTTVEYARLVVSVDRDKVCSSRPVHVRASPVPTTKPEAKHIIFELATSLERLDESLDAIANWAGGTYANIIAVIEPHPDEEYLDGYFSLVKVLYKWSDWPTVTKWAAFIDDDTFFPSMANLVSLLEAYDFKGQHYIGGITEDFRQMYSWGYMGYGGAGVFLSIPLLAELNKHYDACNAVKDTGDRRHARCIYTYTTTKLAWEHDLHQLDLHGDASGFYESGRPLPLSLHHWKSWFPVDMVELNEVAWNWYLVNGFALIRYSTPPPELPGEGPLSMEKTWEDSVYGGSDDGGALKVGENSVRQFYVRQQPASGDGEPDQQQPDQVLEVVWRSKQPLMVGKEN
ncbi:hypothetical protein VTN00DRAFT_1258 [Thermoascus crustaceus]|uniref:uncharacterized protein n=1 Tax=Thermoascus crustaceus TaxID=5088 RepID=UPI0037435F3B